MNLNELLVSSAFSALSQQTSEGAMPAGRNGPWRTPETPVRNTGYWLLTFIKAYKLTGDSVFRSAAEASANYLVQPRHRPGGDIFFHREAENGDCGNGLVGQAWSIEAMLLGGIGLEREEMFALAENCFLAHRQDKATGLWHGMEIDGRAAGICRTFNQQLWFAAMGAGLAEALDDDEIRQRSEAGLRGLFSCVATYRFGMFEHVIRVPARWAFRCPRAAMTDSAARFWRGRRNSPRQVQLAVGYHSFCLYALALLKRTWPDHRLWKRRIIQTALAAIDTPEYRNALDGNRFSFSYNLTGIENAYALEVFSPDSAVQRQWWLDQQFERTFDAEASFLDRGACDPATAAARLYEAIRLEDVEVGVEMPEVPRPASVREAAEV